MDSEYLPPDMIFEVLTRTTLETLDTCKAVSKEWKTMIYDSSFLITYLKRTNNLFGYIIQDLKSCKHISMFVPIDNPRKGNELCIKGSFPHDDDIKILASCKQGLLCCEKQGRYCRYYIGKPATRQWQSLPNPKLRYWTAAVGVMVVKSKPLHFKIVRLSEINQSNMRPQVSSMTWKYNCEVFDSHIWAWRTAKGVSLPYEEALTFHQPVISVGEIFYWQTYANNVLAFNVANEHFWVFSLPESVWNYKQKRLLEYEGGLGLTCLSDDGKMEVWQWRNNRHWTSRIVVDLGGLKSSRCPISFCNSDTAVMKTDSDIVFCRLEEGNFSRVSNVLGLCGREVFPFRSDLHNVDFGGGR